MDSQQRHELEQNDLAAFLGDFGTFWNRWGTPIVGTLALAALIFAGYNLITQRAHSSRETAWLDLFGSTSVESLQLVAEDTNNAAVRTLANLRAGDLRVAEANALEVAAGRPLLEEARAHYRAALDAAPHKVYELNALEGLAVVAESLYETDGARELYERVKSAAGQGYPQWAARADRHLALLAEVSTPVTFAPEPPPETPEASATETAVTPETPETTENPAPESPEIAPNRPESPQPPPDSPESAPENPETPEAPEAPATPQSTPETPQAPAPDAPESPSTD